MSDEDTPAAGQAELRWSAWMPLMAAHPLALAQLPSYSGIYRVRAASDGRLLWIGWAENGVRQTMERLSRQVHLPVEPFDDPNSPALLLWRMRHQGRSFEVSGTVLNAADGDATARALRDVYVGNRHVSESEPQAPHDVGDADKIC